MAKSKFVDFKAVKASITMEMVLTHYGILDRFKRSGASLSGPCPIHKGSNPTQFRVSTEKNIWNCFSECKHGGNTLDFIAKMENVSIHAAALKAIEWFKLDPEAMSADSEQEASFRFCACTGTMNLPVVVAQASRLCVGFCKSLEINECTFRFMESDVAGLPCARKS